MFGMGVAVATAAPVGFTDVAFDDPVAGRVEARIYYPARAPGRDAEPDGAAHPLAGFLHGWLGSAWMYDGTCGDLAARGFVVASLDTETGLVLRMEPYAQDAVALLHEVTRRSADPSDPLAGTVSDADWTLLGHSMGGATLARVLVLEPAIRTAVSFMPYEGYADWYGDLATWDGSLLLLSGSHDTTAPPDMQADWFAAASGAERSLWGIIEDAGHNAVDDLAFSEDPMPDAAQGALVSELALSFVLAEHAGEEDRWADLLGHDGIAWASRSHAPALWLADEDTLGVAGLGDGAAELWLGADESGADAVPAGTVTLEDGIGEFGVEIPTELRGGDVFARVRTGGAWTRAVLVAEGPGRDEPAPVDPDPVDDAPAADPEPSVGPTSDPATGCATAPSGAWGLLGILALGRRRR